MHTHRYFIGLALGGRDKEAVDQLRRRLAERFKVYRALNSPPHLTLFYPFEISDVSPVEEGLEEIARRQAGFVLPVRGFGSFREDVWFIDPEQDERLAGLKRAVVELMERRTGLIERNAWKGFHFHVTLAFRDLTPETHRQIGEFLGEEEPPVRELNINALTLFRLKDSGGWETAASFLLKGRG